MNYYSYPYGSPYADPYFGRVMNPTPAIAGSNIEPPYPSGTTITPQTPNPTPIIPSLTTEEIFEQSLNPSLALVSKYFKGQQSYIENLLRLNRGKLCAAHMTFSGEGENRNKVFVGELEGSARDHFILKDPNTGHYFVLLMVYLDYIDFPEEINYYYAQDGVINIIDENLYEEIPALNAIKQYKEEFEKYKAEQLKKASTE